MRKAGACGGAEGPGTDSGPDLQALLERIRRRSRKRRRTRNPSAGTEFRSLSAVGQFVSEYDVNRYTAHTRGTTPSKVCFNRALTGLLDNRRPEDRQPPSSPVLVSPVGEHLLAGRSQGELTVADPCFSRRSPSCPWRHPPLGVMVPAEVRGSGQRLLGPLAAPRNSSGTRRSSSNSEFGMVLSPYSAFCRFFTFIV